MSFAKSERDYPEGKYIHTECKWCGCSYIGPKHENACKKCNDILQRMGGFANLFGKGEESKTTAEERLREIDKKLDEAHARVISLQNMRREHINRHDLNKEKS
ncbi:TPA: hypothetical protein ACS72U_001739 [Providencia alcalifaciens]